MNDAKPDVTASGFEASSGSETTRRASCCGCWSIVEDAMTAALALRGLSVEIGVETVRLVAVVRSYEIVAH